MENGTEKPSGAVKKVPVRIVRSQGMPETENGTTFPRPDEASAAGTGGPDISKLGRLGASGQDSVFCTFTRQKELDEPGVTSDQRERDAAIPTMSEEQKREELARDIMDKDKSLADILDQSKMKTTMDLMEGLFPQGEQLLEGAHPRKKAPAKPPNATRQAEERSGITLCRNNGEPRGRFKTVTKKKNQRMRLLYTSHYGHKKRVLNTQTG